MAQVEQTGVGALSLQRVKIRLDEALSTDGAVQRRELDQMAFHGPFQIKQLYDMVLSQGAQFPSYLHFTADLPSGAHCNTSKAL